METNQDFLSEVPLFSGLPNAALITIAKHAQYRTYRKQTVIVDKGDDTSALFVIASGRIKIFIADDDGHEIVLNEQGPGEHFGELALLSDSPRTASAMTLEDSALWVLHKQAFLDCLAQYPGITLNLIRSLADRVCRLTDNVSDLALLDIYERVVRLLLRSAEHRGVTDVVENLSQQEIANRVGASRAMVSRIFKDLRIGGYISVKGRRILIHKKLPPAW
ncbi:MAG: Crp/Fnr family transcriptional regulator [Pseudomonadota bacterium]